MSVLDALLGVPFVYRYVRPFAIGGLDMSQVFEALDIRETDTLIDVGCGTGIALELLPRFGKYYGFDTDLRALKIARERAQTRSEECVLEAREMTADDVKQAQPDLAVLSGLLHHVDDEGCIGIFRALRASDKLRQVVVFDPSFFPNELFSNVLTVLDRGQYGRRPVGYMALAEKGGFEVVSQVKIPAKRTGKSRVHYNLMKLKPKQDA